MNDSEKRALRYVQGGRDPWAIAYHMQRAEYYGRHKQPWTHFVATVPKHEVFGNDKLLIAIAYIFGLLDLPLCITYSGDKIENGIDARISNGTWKCNMQFRIRNVKDSRKTGKPVDLVVYVNPDEQSAVKFLRSLHIERKLLHDWEERIKTLSNETLITIEYVLNHWR